MITLDTHTQISINKVQVYTDRMFNQLHVYAEYDVLEYSAEDDTLINTYVETHETCNDICNLESISDIGGTGNYSDLVDYAVQQSLIEKYETLENMFKSLE